MSSRGKGRWLLWICGMGAIAALVAVVVSWSDLVMHYHLERLHRDPASLPSFLVAPEGTAKKLAARAFVREPLGRETVVSLFLDYFEKARAESILKWELNPARGPHPGWKGTPRALGDVENAIVGYRGRAQVPGNLMFWAELRWRNASQNGWFLFRNDPTIIALAEILVECRGASVDISRYPGLRVEVLSLESAFDRARRWTEPWEGPPHLQPQGWFKGTWAPMHQTNPEQSSALLLSRIPR